MSSENYDILNILGHSIDSSSYKVKDRKTGQTLVWQVVDYENKSNSNKEHMVDHIKKQIEMSHPNILKFHDIIDQEENKILYIVTEYCENGSIKDVIETCLANNTYFSEELVCKILYQIAFAIKTADNFVGKLCIKEIFLDEDFNIKLFNFKLNDILKEAKMCHLGLLLYEICTFKTFTKSTYEIELKQMEKIYSHSLLSLITSLVEDRTELRKNISEVLCHSTILLRSTQWLKEKCFVNSRQSEKCISLQKDINNKDGSKLYTLKLEKLRKKEASLQVREQQLNEREYKLMLKEKKIALMDRAAKEKLQQAELYLKRCREPKSVSSESSKSTRKEKKISYENLDATYVSCGDSILLPTSSKLNVNKIIKPTSFTRTLSERRIRFKGHSPLKEIDFNKRNARQSKSKKAFFRKNDSGWLTCSEDNDKSSLEGNTKLKRCNKAKQLFSDKNTYQNDILISSDMQCKSITWTEENKKHAFELLRVMNDDKENQGLQVKHTYL